MMLVSVMAQAAFHDARARVSWFFERSARGGRRGHAPARNPISVMPNMTRRAMVREVQVRAVVLVAAVV